MATIGDIIKRERKARDWTQAELGKRVGVSRAAVAQWENGDSKGLKPENLISVADAFEMDVHDLVPGFPRHKKSAARIIQAAPSELLIDSLPPSGRVPLISWVQAGEFASVVDNYHPGDGEIWVETTVPVRQHTYALRVQGDSMETEFAEGDILIVEPDLNPENGSFVIVRTQGNDECTFKKLVRDGDEAFLKPLNRRYRTHPFPRDGVIAGVVREKIKRYA